MVDLDPDRRVPGVRPDVAAGQPGSPVGPDEACLSYSPAAHLRSPVHRLGSPDWRRDDARLLLSGRGGDAPLLLEGPDGGRDRRRGIPPLPLGSPGSRGRAGNVDGAMIRRVFPYLVGTAVVAAIVAGLVLVGLPSAQRMRRIDQIRVD